MKTQPEFTLWPWKLLSVATPLMALASAVLVYHGQERRDETQVRLVYFSVMGAANGYLMAVAIGDFGLSMRAIPTGMLAGFAAVHLVATPAGMVVYSCVLSLIILARVVTLVGPAGCFGVTVLCIIAALFYNAQFSYPLKMIGLYCFVCGAIAATMPLERDPKGVFDAWLAGTWTSMLGGMAGLVCALAVLMLASRMAFRAEWEVLFMAGAIGMVPANYRCIQRLFIVTERLQDVPEPSTEAPAISAQGEAAEIPHAEQAGRTGPAAPG